jgi:drug/metabolite transporter (DMT)-like permease
MLAVRSSVATAILLALLPFVGGVSTLRTTQPWRHALRSLLGIGAFTLFFAGLRAVPLADGVLVAFGSPFILTALSLPILHEPVSLRQWLAVALGFVGVVLIVRPQGGAIPIEAILVVLASVCYALTMILTRLMTRGERSSESSFAFVFYTLGGQALGGLVVAPLVWQPLPPVTIGLLVAMGVLGLVGNFGLTIAFRRAPVAVVAPFEYVALVWASLFGLVVFGDFPTLRVWLGAALIVAAGLYAVLLARSDAG